MSGLEIGDKVQVPELGDAVGEIVEISSDQVGMVSVKFPPKQGETKPQIVPLHLLDLVKLDADGNPIPKPHAPKPKAKGGKAKPKAKPAEEVETATPDLEAKAAKLLQPYSDTLATVLGQKDGQDVRVIEASAVPMRNSAMGAVRSLDPAGYAEYREVKYGGGGSPDIDQRREAYKVGFKAYAGLCDAHKVAPTGTIGDGDITEFMVVASSIINTVRWQMHALEPEWSVAWVNDGAPLIALFEKWLDLSYTIAAV